jgi:tRNA G10  N-methylase Trm11
MLFEYMKTPLNKYTFSNKRIKSWVEQNCRGKVLNLFAGKTHLNVQETRNDIDPNMPANYHLDARECAETLLRNKETYDTIVLDPPYAYRKSMEFYNGYVASPFNQLKNTIKEIVATNGCVITFGYHSVSMGQKRGFEQEKILLMYHGGAIHDTIAVIERKT